MRAGDPVRRHRPAPDAVLRLPPGGLRAPAGSASARTAAATGFQISQRADFFEVEVGLETTLKRPDHQHPRRAARRRRPVPPAARDHRRRQHVRGRDLSQGRHHGARADDDRGRRASPTDLCGRPARSPRCTRSRHDPTLQPPCRLRDGRTADRRPAAVEYLEQAHALRRATGTAATSTRTRRRAGALGVACWPGWRRTRC